MTNLSKWLESQANLAQFWNQWKLEGKFNTDFQRVDWYVNGAPIYVGYKKYVDYMCVDGWYESPMNVSLDDLFTLLNMRLPRWELSHCENADGCWLRGWFTSDSIGWFGATVREAVIMALKGDLE